MSTLPHIRRGPCPQCRKYRTLDHLMTQPTGEDTTRVTGRHPKNPTKQVRVCQTCAEKEQ
jgi:hypothetical protein